MPDLVVDRATLTNHVAFETKDFGAENCAVVEGCIAGVGTRRIMRFAVLVVNQGFLAIEPPLPATRPDLFMWSPCHGHYHYEGFAAYELIDNDGNIVALGHKQAYCMLDSSQELFAPHVPCTSAHTCDVQGIMPGWGDLYSNDLDCQWIDISGVPAGDYQLRVYANFDRSIAESSYENNIETVPITIPEDASSTTGNPTGTSTGAATTGSATTGDEVGADKLNTATTVSACLFGLVAFVVISLMF